MVFRSEADIDSGLVPTWLATSSLGPWKGYGGWTFTFELGMRWGGQDWGGYCMYAAANQEVTVGASRHGLGHRVGVPARGGGVGAPLTRCRSRVRSP